MELTTEFVPAIETRTEPIQQRSAARITALLDAAASLIDEHGIDGLTTSEVASRSESSVGVVYRYFPNIQSLLQGLATRNMELFSARVFEELNADPGQWRTAIHSTIDVFVDLMRNEPGFRALRFGDVIHERFLDHEITSNTVIARRFEELLVKKYGLIPSPALSFDLEVMVSIADALMHRAFSYERDGDMRFVDRLRTVVEDLLRGHESIED